MNYLAAALAATSALGLAAPAFAGGMEQPVMESVPAAPVVMAAPAPMAGDWTGFYAGGSLSYGQTETDGLDDEDGAFYGAHAGYMYDLGRVVVGGELEIEGSDVSFGGADLDNVQRLKLRAGYDAGSFMPYVTAGVARANVSGDLDGEADGQFAGLGVDYRMGQSFVVGAEVLRSQYDDVADTDVDVDATTVGLRASFQF